MMAQSSWDSVNTEGLYYTEDIIKCSLCEIKLKNLDEYVLHMIIVEHCLLFLEPSSQIENVLLPRFIQQIDDPDALPSKFVTSKIEIPPIEQIKATQICKIKKEPKEIKWEAHSQRYTGSEDSQKYVPQPMCHICGQIFSNLKSMTNHLETVHSNNRSFGCGIDGCNVKFKTKGSLTRHKLRHTDERPFKCDTCGLSFRESGALLRHQRSDCCHKTKIPSKYGINLPLPSHKACSKTDPLLQMKTERSSIEIVSDDESEYMRSIEETKSIVLQQTQAEASDAVTMDEKKPFERLANVLRNSFVCPMCFQSHDTNAKLLRHMQKHYAEIGQECSSCKKKFNSPSSLSPHLLTHFSVRQYQCCQCGKQFKLKSHAQNHLITHSRDKKLPCPECGRLFKTISSRNTHMKIHTGEKPFQCDRCSKSFGVKSSLERHVRVHTGDKPFVCPNCNEGFKEHGTLSRHMKNTDYCLRGSLLLAKEEHLSATESEQDRMSVISDHTVQFDGEFTMDLEEPFTLASTMCEIAEEQETKLCILSEKLLRTDTFLDDL